MLFESIRPDLPWTPLRITRPLPTKTDVARFALHSESAWRHVEAIGGDRLAGGITASRWTDLDASCRLAEAVTPPDHFVVGVSLRCSRLTLRCERRIIFDGVMRPGTLHVSSPGQHLQATFHGPCDLLHLQVPCAWVRRHAENEFGYTGSVVAAFDHVVVHDSITEQLARSLVDSSTALDRSCTQAISEAMALRLFTLFSLQQRVSPLPTWRLKRVLNLIEAEFAESLSLARMATAAGLSRMHFAAQFRAATGYRPHEYLLFRRTERAKERLRTAMPIAQVALTVGFQAQSHFTTVFRRLTGDTPARWRRAHMVSVQAVSTGRRTAHSSRHTGEHQPIH